MRVRRRSAVLPVVVAAMALACGDGGEPEPPPRPELSSAVLQPGDLRAEFRQVEVGPQLRTEQPATGARAAPSRFGRRAGWKARYARRGTQRTDGPLVVEARVDEFEDAGGAQRELAAHRREARQRLRSSALPARVLRDPPVGDDAFAYMIIQPGLSPVRHVTVAWRAGALTASVTVSGFRGVDRVAGALARRQQQRMADATRQD